MTRYLACLLAALAVLVGDARAGERARSAPEIRPASAVRAGAPNVQRDPVAPSVQAAAVAGAATSDRPGVQAQGLDAAYEKTRPQPAAAADVLGSETIAEPALAQSVPASASSARSVPAPTAPRVKKSAAKRWLETAAAPLKLLTNRPTNERDWSPDVAVLPSARFHGDEVVVRDVRDFEYRSTRDFTPRYRDKSFKLSDVKSVWFGVEPFGSYRGPAHTFASFGLADGTFLTVSVEIRRVKGDQFSAWKGLWNNYELAYVISEERDVVGLRTNHRESDVYLYPIQTKLADSPGRVLKDMLERANALKEKPEFYNSLFNTCTTNLLKHFNNVSPRKIGWSREILFPVDSDQLAYKNGLLDAGVPFEELRRRALITPKARAGPLDDGYSRRIRE